MMRMPDGMPAIFRHFSHLVEDSVRGSLRSRLILGSQTLLVLTLTEKLTEIFFLFLANTAVYCTSLQCPCRANNNYGTELR